MAQGGRTWQLAVALAVVIAATGVLVYRLASGPEPASGSADWVCDHCGAKAKRPFDSVSPDCPDCDKGQMVQRVFFKCTKCGAVFEGYQFNWSPNAPRAAPKRAEADADQARQARDEGPKVLIRRPDGPWAWTGSRVGLAAVRKLKCPNCGEGPPRQFVKQVGESKDDAAQ